MKPTAIFTLLLLSACQVQAPEEPEIMQEEPLDTLIVVQEPEPVTVDVEELLIEGVDLSRTSWDIVRSSFPSIDSFPIKSAVFPLSPIVIESDTLKVNGRRCFSFPKDIIDDFMENHVLGSDSLAIWYEDNKNHISEGTSFEYGVYPVGKFKKSDKDYYIYFVLDYLTGRGSHDVLFYLASENEGTWESTLIGEKSYSIFNTYEVIDGEEFHKDRMISETGLLIQLREDKLEISHYSGEYVSEIEFDVFEDGEVQSTTELILE